MGLFPFFTDEDSNDLQLEDPVVESDTENDEPYREYELIPETGKLTGRILEGTDAIAVWAVLTLKSARYQYPIYSWDYGEEFSAMIGYAYEADILQSEVKRMVEECLLVNEHILSINDLLVDHRDDILHVSFSMETDQGDVGVDLDV